MEPNPIQNYLNRDIRGAVTFAEIIAAKTKDGGTYYPLEISFSNGFKKRVFLNDAERFAVLNALDQLDTAKHFEL